MRWSDGVMNKPRRTTAWMATAVLALCGLFSWATNYASSFQLSGTSSSPNNEAVNFKPTRASGVLQYDGTVVVHLSGEMGNNLIHIVHGFCLQLWAMEEFGLRTNLVVKHQPVNKRMKAAVPKWKSARDDVQRCFPNLRSFDFELGNSRDAAKRMKEQPAAFPDHAFNKTKLDLVNDPSMTNVRLGMEHWHALVESKPVATNETSANATTDSEIYYPFVAASTMHIPHFIDKYLNQIRDFLVFDEQKCCALTPHPDESVFHYRNFVGELGVRAKSIGFDELSPNIIESDLFGHLKSGDKVAITSRLKNTAVNDIVSALESRNMQVRVITGQSGVQDFCFLLKAEKELAGMARSTYMQFAAYLGNSKIARLVILDKKSARERQYNLGYNWTHASLKDRVRFQIF